MNCGTIQISAKADIRYKLVHVNSMVTQYYKQEQKSQAMMNKVQLMLNRKQVIESVVNINRLEDII